MEIGSEFWAVPVIEQQNTLLDGNVRCVLSGRTALDLIARDLKKERDAKSIYLPAYCCDSMIAPFERQGFAVKFYDVKVCGEKVHRAVLENHGCDVILLMDYFGFASKETAAIAQREKRCGTAVIVDCVQSAFSGKDAASFADYTVTSWRKWFFSCAATAEKTCGEWLIQEAEHSNEAYISLRRTAAACKADYIENGQGEKSGFLTTFGEAEELLDAEFGGYGAEKESVEELRHVDIDFVIVRRRENADFLLRELKSLPQEIIRPLYEKMGQDDVPLFVPVLMKPALRQQLRRYLIEHEVYCPIHWPKKMDGADMLYNGELSLVCDQRYGLDDMKREITLIREFLKNNGYLL